MITRNWLKSLGASDYLAKCLTKGLSVAGREGRSNAYDAELVLACIEAYSQNPRIRPATQALLPRLADELKQLIDSTATDALANHPMAEDPLAAAMAQVSQANKQFEATAKGARKISSDFEAYRSQRGTDFKSRNNVVTFA